MKRKLIAVALIAVLICVGLGSIIACAPTTKYDLIINSTAGGSVTPVEGAHTYTAGTDVNLVATPDAGYRFVDWTGNVVTIANVNAATTTITMNGDYTITANFALGTLIAGVPDTSQSNQPPQSPTQTIPSTVFITNYCAPMAMVNIVCYWDVVMEHANAQNVTQNVTDDFIPETVAEYLGYFMNTNDTGSPDRPSKGGGHAGTVDPEIALGTLDFVRWDNGNPLPSLPDASAPALPGGKLGYDWTVTLNWTTDYNLSLDFYMNEIDAGRPLVVSFSYWNPKDLDIAVIDPETGETIDVFEWEVQVPGSYSPNPEEQWVEGIIGHAVTGVGYILGWDPDGDGNSDDYVIVHDNWPTTPINVAIPWDHWICLFAVDPGADE